MLLTDIKNYIRFNHATSLLDMRRHFNVQPDVLREMLALLIRKGQIRKCSKTPVCGTKCFKCEEAVTEIYEWTEM